MNATTTLKAIEPCEALLSCNGTLILHEGHHHECSDDPRCQVPAIAHEFTTLCDDRSCCPR